MFFDPSSSSASTGNPHAPISRLAVIVVVAMMVPKISRHVTGKDQPFESFGEIAVDRLDAKDGEH